MALRMRKDIKKSSYYVWFLGAQESKGLRGAEYIHPVVKSLVQRERDVEPFKVTLQVSHKGLKIVQNIPPQAVKPGKGGSGKPEVVKHFIPHHAVTCVLQDEDIVSCILLLYNPVTKCPVHVHAYRCDSVETAEILRGQLQTLIERPENQKKLGEIETRLRAKGLLPPPPQQQQQRQPVLPPGSAAPVSRRSGGGGSDGRSTSTRESESSGGSSSTAERLSGGHQERIANLYDSLAAELREKLGTASSESKRGRRQQPHAPILLPPRDYDTVHRQKGNLTAIELRRCLNTNIVGVNAQNTRNLTEQQTSRGGRGSSGGSSGIGSDHAPSPDGQDRESDPRYLDNQSSSDEEWNEQPSEDSLFLVQPSWRGQDLSLPRARRVHSSGIESPASPSSPVANVSGTPPEPQAPAVFRRRRLAAEERQRSPSPASSTNNNTNNYLNKKPLSPRERFKDAKEKFLLLEREELQRRQPREPPIAPSSLSQQHSRGKGYPVHDNWSRSRDSEDDLEDRPARGYYGNDTPDGFDTPPEPDLDDEEDDVLEHGYGSYPQHEEEMLRHRVYRAGGRRAEARYRERLLSPTRQPQHRALSREDSGPGVPLERYRSPMRGNPQPVIGSPEMPRRSEHRGPTRGNPQPVIGSPEMPRRSEHRGPTRGNPQPISVSPEMPRRLEHRGPTRGNPQPISLSPEMQRRAESRGPMRGNPQPIIPSPEMQRRAESRGPMRGNPQPIIPSPEMQRRADSRGPMRGNPQPIIGSPEMQRRADSRGPMRGNPQPIIPSPEMQRRVDHRGPIRSNPQAVVGSPEMQRRGDSRGPLRGNPQPVIGSPEMQRRGDSRGPMRGNPQQSPEMQRRADHRSAMRGNPQPIMASPEMQRRADPRIPRPGAYPDKKRRSMFDALEEERRRNSNELAKEFKRRSYQDGGVLNQPGYQELSEQERFPGLDRETARIQHHVGNRYRHSYAEPHLHHHYPHDILHRTNSSVSSGRVGIAAVHPY